MIRCRKWEIIAWVAIFFCLGVYLENTRNKLRTYWVVGHYLDDAFAGDKDKSPDGYRWTIEGLYDTEEAAVDACVGPYYFVGPMPLNKPTPGSVWTGAYYPYEAKP